MKRRWDWSQVKILGRLVIWLALATLLWTGSARAQNEPPSPESVSIDYTLGERVRIRARFPAEPAIASATLYLRAADETNTYSTSGSVEAPNQFQFEVNLTQYPMRTFTSATYWFELTLKDGESVILPERTLYYDDNRFNWQIRRSPPFQVHWYEGDAAYAQAILDVAAAGLENLGELIDLPEIRQVEIYVYARPKDLRDALQLSTQKWVGAHADPDLSVMVVALPVGPDQRLEMERQIPHELAHIVLYDKIGDDYLHLPTWFIEGLASITELYPNPDYYVLLNSAFERQTLLPMESLCLSFPRDASGAYLAYAQSASFTRYIQRQYGSRGLEDLIRQYAEGVDCARGVELALGVPLAQLERDWRQAAFGEEPLVTAFGNLLPWLVIGLAMLVAPLVLTFQVLRRRSAPQRSNS